MINFFLCNENSDRHPLQDGSELERGGSHRCIILQQKISELPLLF